jgi:hypothetical protein
MPINIHDSQEIPENREDPLGIFDREFLWPATGDRLFRASGVTNGASISQIIGFHASLIFGMAIWIRERF